VGGGEWKVTYIILDEGRIRGGLFKSKEGFSVGSRLAGKLKGRGKKGSEARDVFSAKGKTGTRLLFVDTKKKGSKRTSPTNLVGGQGGGLVMLCKEGPRVAGHQEKK